MDTTTNMVMVTHTIINIPTTINIEQSTVPTILGLMRILQFGDSMLPVGAFSFSNGLESAVQVGLVHNLDTLSQYVHTAAEQAAMCDGIAVLAAFRAVQAGDFASVLMADRAVLLRKMNEEMRTMTTRMGRKFGEMAVRVLDAPTVIEWLAAIKNGSSPGTYPIAQSLIFAALGLGEQEAFAVHQYGIASMILGAALRLMKINHLDTQAILFDVNQQATTSYQQIQSASLDDMATYTPLMDVVSAVHIKSTVRMFMN